MGISYSQYIHSDKWKVKRQQAIDRANGKCQLCGNPARTAHHNTYERLGDELPGDLIALCWPCHHAHHKRRKPVTAKDVQSRLTRKARQTLRRLNLIEQTAMLTPSERKRRAKVAAKFLFRLSRV